jgi:hypothetical protein
VLVICDRVAVAVELALAISTALSMFSMLLQFSADPIIGIGQCRIVTMPQHGSAWR